MPFQLGLLSLTRRGRGRLLSNSGLKLATTQKGRPWKGVKMSAAAPHVPNSPGCRAIHNCLHPSLFSPECNYFKQQNPGLFYSNPKTHHFYSRRHFPRPCFKHPTPQPSPALANATGKPLNFRRSTSQNLPPSPPSSPFCPPPSSFLNCVCMHACLYVEYRRTRVCPRARV